MLEGWRATIRSKTWQKLSQDTEFLFNLVDDHLCIRISGINTSNMAVSKHDLFSRSLAIDNRITGALLIVVSIRSFSLWCCAWCTVGTARYENGVADGG
jgi:hypothetical protein